MIVDNASRRETQRVREFVVCFLLLLRLSSENRQIFFNFFYCLLVYFFPFTVSALSRSLARSLGWLSSLPLSSMCAAHDSRVQFYQFHNFYPVWLKLFSRCFFLSTIKTTAKKTHGHTTFNGGFANIVGFRFVFYLNLRQSKMICGIFLNISK